MTHLPCARRQGLITRELWDELLAYDLERHRAHCLSTTAALVWKYCDGKRDVEELTRIIKEQSDLKVSEEVVLLALCDLKARKLISWEAERKIHSQSLSRREMIRRVTTAGLVALPLITTLVSPTPAQAVSCSPDCGNVMLGNCCPPGCPCATPQACCSGTCNGGFC
ncbi:MAG TPA: PqqD family protein [Pyrinomonadaceae bacterium]|nr:PqqD family protein [Pyrinomonadaceae bacterium]